MGASWKIQSEADRVLRKVQESIEVIEVIWKKIYDTENVNQKEMFEVDLRKEIRKLQKYKEQIKNWQSNAIKDNKGLMDARMDIKKEMERFKTWEKETKIKAFSREGLIQQSKMDPKEKEKSETRDWVNKGVSDLKSQIDSFETEMERLSDKKGQAKLPRLRHLKKSVTRHQAHITKLESILRHLDNDEIRYEQVNEVMEHVDDYIERNQDDFEEFNDVDEIYSPLALDKLEAIEDLVRPARSKVGRALRMKPSSKTVAVQSMATVSSIQQSTSVQEQAKETTLRGSNTNLVARTSPWKVNNLSVPVTPAASNPSPGDTVQSSPINNPICTKEEDTSGFPVHKPSPSLSNTPVKGMAKSELSSCPSIDVPFPVLGSLQSTSEITKKNALGADERVGASGMVQVLESSSSTRIFLPLTAKVNEVISSADIGNTADGAVTAGKVFSPPAIPGMQCRPGSPFQKQNDPPTSVHPQSAQQALLSAGLIDTDVGLNKVEETQQPLSDSLITDVIPSTVPSLNNVTCSLIQPPTSVHPQSAQQTLLSAGLIDTDVGLNKVEETQQPLSDSLITDVIPSTVPSKNPTNDDDDLKASYATLDASVGVASGSMTEPAELPRNIDLSELGAIDDDFDFGGSTANSGAIHDQAYILLMLEAALLNIPQPGDFERESVPVCEITVFCIEQQVLKPHVVVAPSSYPQKKAPFVSNPAFWEGAVNDTLFFAFYYQQNSYQQFLAARALKKKKWRYHMENETWFRSLEEPRVKTHEYEEGAYEFFKVKGTNEEMNDEGWCKGQLTSFTFEYKHMEKDPNL